MSGDHDELYLFPPGVPITDLSIGPGTTAAYMSTGLNTDAGAFTEQAEVTVTPSDETRWSELEACLALAGVEATLKTFISQKLGPLYWITIPHEYGKYQVSSVKDGTMRIVFFSLLEPGGVLLAKGVTDNAVVIEWVKKEMKPW